MLPTAVDLLDGGAVWNLNFGRFELILERGEAQGTVPPFTPTIDRSLIIAEHADIPATSDLPDETGGNIFHQYGGVLEPHLVVNTELAALVRPHGIEVVLMGDEAGMLLTACHHADRDVVGAELREAVRLIRWIAQAKAELTTVVATPREHLSELIIICCLNVITGETGIPGARATRPRSHAAVSAESAPTQLRVLLIVVAAAER